MSQYDRHCNMRDLFEELARIYHRIPSIKCMHCHQCCGPIVWFEPEERLIRQYLWCHRKPYLVWSKEEFHRHDMKCPYLQVDRCSIYPVRPIVCRFQGAIAELPCKQKKTTRLSVKQVQRIQREFTSLVRKMKSMDVFYTTLQKDSKY